MNLLWYRNGEFQQGTPHLQVDDFGVFQGVTVVERMRTCGGKVFAMRKHMNRLAASCELLHIARDNRLNAIPDAIEACLEQNAEFVSEQEDVGICVLATPGIVGADQSTVIIYLQTLDWMRIARLRRFGELLEVSAVQQPSPESMPRRAKTRARLHYYLANRNVRRESHATPILIDADGSLTETASANLLLVHQDRILSPPPESILPGVSLEIVRELADDAGMPFVEQPLSRELIQRADEIILTGTGAGIWRGRIQDSQTQNHHDACFYVHLRNRFDERAGLSLEAQAAGKADELK